MKQNIKEYKVVRNTTNSPYLLTRVEDGAIVTKELKQGDTFDLNLNQIVTNRDQDFLVATLYNEYYGLLEEVGFKYPYVDLPKGSTFVSVKDDGKTKTIVQEKLNAYLSKYREALKKEDDLVTPSNITVNAVETTTPINN